MSKIDEIRRALEKRERRPDGMNFAALELMIAAALEDARREGAEQMREAAAKVARKVPLYYGSGEQADEELAQAIEDLPLPTGERQAVQGQFSPALEFRCGRCGVDRFKGPCGDSSPGCPITGIPQLPTMEVRRD